MGEELNVWGVLRQWSSGSMIGKLIREHGEENVKDAVLATLKKDPAQKLQYLMACLRGTTRDRRPPSMMSEAELCQACEERGISTIGKDKWELIKMLTQ